MLTHHAFVDQDCKLIKDPTLILYYQNIDGTLRVFVIVFFCDVEVRILSVITISCYNISHLILFSYEFIRCDKNHSDDADADCFLL